MAENTIDNLSIEITTSADAAARVFDRLASSAGRLKGAARSAASGFKDISEAATEMGNDIADSAERSGESVEELANKIDSVSKRQFSPSEAGVFAHLTKDSEILGMKLEDAKSRLADLLNADTPDNRAIANTTAEVKRLETAFEDARKAEEGLVNSFKNTSGISRFWNALKSVGSQISSGFVQAVHKGTDAVGLFLKSIVRISFYRAIRSIIKDLGQSFRDLYGYSKLFGTDFSNSMDRITTASVYLRNSLAAMVAPLVNMFAPALDMLADKIVDIMNFVNQLFAAINGQETYTVARKIATTWESTFDTTANHANRRIKEVKNALLGFDEINKLNGATPASSVGSTGKSPYTQGYETMFEEKPLEGFFKEMSDVTSGMPDWLKWLLGGTALVGGFLLIKEFIPWLINKIKDLFALTIPNWLKWLFGGGGGKDEDRKINLNIPDEKVKVDLKKGDWSALDELQNKVIRIPVKLDKVGWNTLSEFVGIYSPIVYVRLGKAAWTTLSEFVGTYSPIVYVRLGKAGWSTLSQFIGTYSPIVYVRLGKAGWTSLSQFIGIYSPLVYVRLGKAGWTSLSSYVGEYSPLVYVRLGKTAWTTLSAFVGVYSPIVYVRLGKTAWTTLEDYVGKYEAEVPVKLVKRWNGSALHELGLDNLDATVYINAVTPWDYYGVMRYLGLDDLYATAWVDVTTPWWQAGKHILDWLGLTNLHTTVTVNTRTVNSSPTNGNGSYFYGGGAGRQRAKGGIYVNGGWSDIPQYASGTTNAGSLFVAGEAGPEIVGHVGGRTEVLNKSQIASAMYSAVQAAMAPATAYFAAAAQSMNNVEVGFDLEALAEMVRQGVEQAMGRSNDYDRQKVELLRSINEKDYNVDVSTSSINRAQTRMNRRAGTTIVPVGT